jgi:hypothetical protein
MRDGSCEGAAFITICAACASGETEVYMQNIFQRHEKKYLISRSQYEVFLPRLLERMEPDRYERYLVQNLYYDTETFESIRASVEKPVYKEKLRLRCYGVPHRENPVFFEMKKKFKGIVYKRRVMLPYGEYMPADAKRFVARDDSQISREIAHFFTLRPVTEKIHISYERRALAGLKDPGLRVTFDTHIRFRLDDLSFTGSGSAGQNSTSSSSAGSGFMAPGSPGSGFTGSGSAGPGSAGSGFTGLDSARPGFIEPSLARRNPAESRLSGSGLSGSGFLSGISGTALLPPEQVLMEIKAPYAVPLWLSRLLCDAGVFPRSFSKYGVWYTDFFLKPSRRGMEATASA